MAAAAQEGGAGSAAPPSRKRDAPDQAGDEEAELPDEVRQRLSALREGGGLD